MIGSTVSHYKIIKQIGVGGMGIVYEAEDTTLKRRVAIKTLKELKSQKARLLREAQAVSRISHPYIATVYDYGETEEGQPFIVMELVEGAPLNEYLINAEPNLPQIVEIILKVAEAVSTAHKHGIIHRDIKPSNIIIGDDQKVKVLDFGLSKQILSDSGEESGITQQNLEATKTQEGVILGTPFYLSPEQVLGEKVDERSDIFALGTLLYECLAGKTPFYAASVIEICAKILRDQPVSPSRINSAVPASLDKIALKALAKEPNRRYQSVDGLIGDLRAAKEMLPQEENFVVHKPLISGNSISQRLKTTVLDALRFPSLLMLSFFAMLVIGLGTFLYLQTGETSHAPSRQAQFWYEQGERAFNDGAFYAASKCFETAVEHDKGFVMAHARRAESLFELGYIEDAREAREQANGTIQDRKINLPAQDSLRLQGINKTLLFDFDSAIESYRQLTQTGSDADKEQAFLDLGRAYERGEKVAEAIESYQKVLNLNADSAGANLRLGILYARQQEYEKSSSFFTAAERIYKIQNNSEGEVEVSYQRGLALSSKGDSTEALEEIRNSLKKAEINNIPYQQVKCLLLMSRVLRSLSKSSESLPFADKAVSLAQQNSINNLHAQSNLELGTVYFYLTKYDDAQNRYDEALRLARQYDATVIEKRVLLQFGAFYVHRHKADDALNYINQVQSFFERGNYKKDMLDLFSIKAQAMTIKGDFKTALDAYYDLLAKADEVGDLVQKARALKGIAKLLVKQDELSKALEPMYKSFAIYNSINKTSEAGYSLIDYTDTLWQLGRYEEASITLNQAEILAEKHKPLKPRVDLVRSKKALSERHFDEAILITNRMLAEDSLFKLASTIEAKAILALALAQSGEKLKAKKVIEEVEIEKAKFEDSEILARFYLIYAEVLYENGFMREAINYAEKAHDAFNQLGKKSFEWQSWAIICSAHRMLNNNNEAHRAALNADLLLSTLSQKWEQKDFKSYSQRPDIKYYRAQLLKSAL